jgi:hypothetical protein
MIWRWTWVKNAALDFDEDDFGNDEAAKWLRQQQQPAAPVAAPAAPLTPQVDTNPPPVVQQPGATPTGYEAFEPTLDTGEEVTEDDDPRHGARARQQRKENDAALTEKWKNELSQLQNLAVEVYGSAFRMYDQQFGQNASGSETGVFKALFEPESTRRASWKKFLSRMPSRDARGRPVSGGYPLLPHDLQRGLGKATEDAINEDLANTPPGQMPRSLEALKNAIEQQDQQVFLLFTEAASAANAAQGQGGESLNKDLGDRGTQRYQLLSTDKINPKSDLGTHMGEQEILAMEDISEAFLKSPQNQQYLQSFGEQLTRISEAMKTNERLRANLKDAGNAMYLAVQNAFKGDSPDGDNLWVKFFLQNQDLILPNADPKRLRAYLDLPPFGHADEGWKILKDLAQKGDPRVQEFFKPHIAHALDELAMSLGVNRIASWKTVNTDFRRIGMMAQRAALHTMRREKGREQDWGTSGRRYLMLKHKSKAAYDALQKVLSGQAAEIGTEKEGGVTYQLFSTGNGRLVLKDPQGHLQEVTADQFPEVSRIVRTQDWVPGVLQDAKTLGQDPKATLGNAMLYRERYNKPTPLMQEFADAAKAHIAQAPDGAAENFDRMGGYRKKVAEKLDQSIQAAGTTWEELAAKLQETFKTDRNTTGPNIRQNPAGWLEKVRSGQPVRYGFQDMNQVAKVLAAIASAKGQQFPPPQLADAAVPPGDPKLDKFKEKHPSYPFYFSPPEYDPYNYDDQTEIAETLPYGFKGYGAALLHRKREADWRGIPFMSPAAVDLFLNVMRIHPNFFNDPRDKQWGKIIMELAGKPAGISKKDEKGSRPMTPEEGEELLRTDRKGNPFSVPEPDIYKNMPSLQRGFPMHQYEKGNDESGKPTYYRVPTEPDLTDMAAEFGIPHDKAKKQKINKLYHILENPDQYSADERRKASEKLQKLREEIQKLPKKQRAKFKHYLYPFRHVYDPEGNPVREPPSKQSMVMFERLLKAAMRINRLATMREQMTKFADTTNDIDTLMDAIADEALYGV